MADFLSLIQDDDWAKKPLTIIVVPGLSKASLEHVFPALCTLFRTNLKRDFEVWALDTKDMSTLAFEKCLKDHLPGEAVDEFLECCLYKQTAKLDDWKTLTQLFQQTSGPNQNVCIWLADGHQNHVLNETVYMANKRITPSILQGWSRVVFEPPLFQSPKLSWNETDHVYRLHPVLASQACQQIWAFRQRRWTHSLWNARAVQAVHIAVRSRSAVFEMLPQLYHVLACVAMKIPDPLEEFAIQRARAGVLGKISPYCRSIDLLTGRQSESKDSNDGDAGSCNSNDPTYVCVRCWVQSDSWAGTPFFVEVIKDDDALEESVNVRLDLRDAIHADDALVFGNSNARFVMASIGDSVPGSPPVEMTMTDDSATILTGRSRLALDVFRGKKMLFVHSLELDNLRAIVGPLMKQCKNVVPEAYDPQSKDGPTKRVAFIKDIRSPTMID